jgi:hypothetical protein
MRQLVRGFTELRKVVTALKGGKQRVKSPGHSKKCQDSCSSKQRVEAEQIGWRNGKSFRTWCLQSGSPESLASCAPPSERAPRSFVPLAASSPRDQDAALAGFPAQRRGEQASRRRDQPPRRPSYKTLLFVRMEAGARKVIHLCIP